jgi:hypothetical protein
MGSDRFRVTAQRMAVHLFPAGNSGRASAPMALDPRVHFVGHQAGRPFAGSASCLSDADASPRGFGRDVRHAAGMPLV